MKVPPLGGRCAWCAATDWERTEQAEQPILYGAIFHDRGGASVARDGEVPGPCYQQAVAAGISP